MDDKTELLFSIYVLPEAKLRAAVGSGDEDLRRRMMTDHAYAARVGLHDHITPPQWRRAVDSLIEGRENGDYRQNRLAGYAVELMLRALTPKTAIYEKPFTGNWYVPLFTFWMDGQQALGNFLCGLWVPGWEKEQGWMKGLAGSFDGLKLSLLPPTRVAEVRSHLSAIAPMAQAFRDYRFGSGEARDQRIEDLIRRSEAGMSDESGAPTEGPAFEAEFLDTVQNRKHFFVSFNSLQNVAEAMEAAMALAVERDELMAVAFHNGDRRKTPY